MSRTFFARGTALAAGVAAGVAAGATTTILCDFNNLSRRSTVGSLAAFRSRLDRIEADLGARRIEAGPQYILYSNPRCPFAHRAHIAALEKGVDFEYKYVPLQAEINQDASGALSKPAHFLERVNPSGTVPAIEVGGVGGDVVNESDICAFFLEDQYASEGTALRPHGALQLARMNHANKVFEPAFFYRVLKNQDPALDAEKVATLEKMLSEWCGLHDTGGGPFVCGGQFSLADCIAFPFFDRFRHTLLEARGYDLWEGDEPWRARMRAWYAACLERPAVQATSMPADFYLEHYLHVANYAGARGKSTMAK